MRTKPLLIILSLTAIICYSVASVIKFGFRKYYTYSFQKLHTAFEDSARYYILFLGNSFTFSGIQPRITDSVTHTSSFNLGMGGAELPEMKFLFQSFLKHHPPPRLLVLQLHYSSFYISDVNNLLLYLFKGGPQPTDELMESSGLPPLGLRRYFPWYRFTFMDDYNRANSIKGLMGKTQAVKGAIYDNGFFKLLADTSEIVKFFEADSGASNQGKKEIYFERGRSVLGEIYRECKRRNIKLVLVHPPLPFDKGFCSITSDKFINQVQKTLPGTDVSVLDFAKDENLRKLNYFMDNTHLNLAGSRIFSLQLARDLKELEF